MEQIAIISDIHGNVPALEAVLNEIKQRNISRILNLGDMIGKGPSSDLVIDICREKCERIVRGNHEELICSETVFGGEAYVKMKEWHKNKIGEKRYEYLKSLENSIDIKMSGKNIRLFHASQIGVCNRVHRSDTKEKHLSMFENTGFTGNLCKPQIVGYGDIHCSFIEIIGEKILFNAGSVGNSLGIDTRASFGIVTGICNSDIEEKLEIEIVKINYDKNKAIEDAKKSDLPDIESFINEIVTGQYRGNKIA
jgi:protein phosphatase